MVLRKVEWVGLQDKPLPWGWKRWVDVSNINAYIVHIVDTDSQCHCQLCVSRDPSNVVLVWWKPVYRLNSLRLK